MGKRSRAPAVFPARWSLTGCPQPRGRARSPVGDPCQDGPVMTTPTADEVLERLDPEQRAVALALRGPVCVLAGAGTGKTRAITHRIAYGVHSGVLNPQQVLAVTFTARAAGEMRGRLRGLGVVRRAGAHVPRRRAAPAHVLLAAGRRWPGACARGEQGPAASARRSGGPHLPAAGAVLRDLAARGRVGQGDPRPLPTTTSPRRPGPAARPPGELDLAEVARALRRVRGGQARPGARSTSRTCCC